jgi:lactate dehydrogenase-like 2-hydroxyacid dehydrogenase
VHTHIKKNTHVRTGTTLLHFLSTYSNQKNGHKQESDIISLHLPLLSETYHVINKETIAKMKKGVIIINVSRGALVDTVAVQGQACYNIGVMYRRI